MSVQGLGERALIERIRRRIRPGPGTVIGPGDDAAALRTGGLTLVTTDAMVEGVHFQLSWMSAEDLGRKAMAVNASDIAAMGGRPRFATLSLLLRADTPVPFVDGLYDGLIAAADGYGVAIVSGNVSSIDGPLVVDVTLLGDVDEGKLVRRSTAHAGDLLIVTGTLGAAAAGLVLLGNGESTERSVSPGLPEAAVQECLRALRVPAPPVAFAAAAGDAGLLAAAIDVSDGLSSDLFTLCRESNAGAEVDVTALPISEATRSVAGAFDVDPVHLALHGGED